MLPRDMYRSCYTVMPVSCVDLLVIQNDKVLLIRRANEPAAGAWWLPGGRVHYRERRRDAAFRKLKEETGLTTADPIELLTDDLIFDQSVDAPLHGVTTVFVCRVAGSLALRLDDQSIEARWLTPDEWLLYELHPFVRRMVTFARPLSRASCGDGQCSTS